MAVLSFVYRGASGVDSHHALPDFHESGHYIVGMDAGARRWRMFRKDLVSTYLDGSHRHLRQPTAPPPPTLTAGLGKGLRPMIRFAGFPKDGARPDGELACAASGLLEVSNRVGAGVVFLCPGPNLSASMLDQHLSRGLYVVPESRVADLIDSRALNDFALSDALPVLVTQRSTKIGEVRTHFAEWAYTIGTHHWELMGVRYRQYIRRVPAKVTADVALPAGAPQPPVAAKPVMVDETYMSWAVDRPPQFDFLEGTVFYKGDSFLQVAYSPGDGFIEVHEGRVGSSAPRAGWLVQELALSLWLETGERPSMAIPVDASTSSCDGVLRMYLAQPEATDA